MQLLNALIAVTNDRNNMLWKTGITPPEVLLLQQLHGADAITQIENAGDVKREPIAELERLKELYPREAARIQNIWRDFPGPAFPVRIDMLMLNPAMLKSAEASAPYIVDSKVA